MVALVAAVLAWGCAGSGADSGSPLTIEVYDNSASDDPLIVIGRDDIAYWIWSAQSAVLLVRDSEAMAEFQAGLRPHDYSCRIVVNGQVVRGRVREPRGREAWAAPSVTFLGSVAEVYPGGRNYVPVEHVGSWPVLLESGGETINGVDLVDAVWAAWKG